MGAAVVEAVSQVGNKLRLQLSCAEAAAEGARVRLARGAVGAYQPWRYHRFVHELRGFDATGAEASTFRRTRRETVGTAHS